MWGSTEHCVLTWYATGTWHLPWKLPGNYQKICFDSKLSHKKVSGWGEGERLWELKREKYFEEKVGIDIYWLCGAKYQDSGKVLAVWTLFLQYCGIRRWRTCGNEKRLPDFFTRLNKLLLIKTPGTVGGKRGFSSRSSEVTAEATQKHDLALILSCT